MQRKINILIALAFASGCTSALPVQNETPPTLPPVSQIEESSQRCQQALQGVRAEVTEARRLLEEARSLLLRASTSEATCAERAQQIRKTVQVYERKLKEAPPPPPEAEQPSAGTTPGKKPGGAPGADPEYSRSDAPGGAYVPPEAKPEH